MKKPLPEDVQKFIAKITARGLGVTVYYDRDGNAYDAKVERKDGKVREVWCN